MSRPLVNCPACGWPHPLSIGAGLEDGEFGPQTTLAFYKARAEMLADENRRYRRRA